MTKKLIFNLFVGFVLVVAGCTSSNLGQFSGTKAIVFKSPTCGCCVGYNSFLEQQGFDVEIVEMQDLTPIKQKYGIPRAMESCHTTIVGDYYIEGHVPIEAIEKLLQEKPLIDGIALPNMPTGTPGMPGMKRGTYNIYALHNGKISDFMNI
jgi:hypothetical protein